MMGVARGLEGARCGWSNVTAIPGRWQCCIVCCGQQQSLESLIDRQDWRAEGALRVGMRKS